MGDTPRFWRLRCDLTRMSSWCVTSLEFKVTQIKKGKKQERTQVIGWSKEVGCGTVDPSQPGNRRQASPASWAPAHSFTQPCWDKVGERGACCWDMGSHQWGRIHPPHSWPHWEHSAPSQVSLVPRSGGSWPKPHSKKGNDLANSPA